MFTVDNPFMEYQPRLEMDDIPVPLAAGRPKFLDQVRRLIREKNLAYSTEKT